jgi:hypothetical protein
MHRLDLQFSIVIYLLCSGRWLEVGVLLTRNAGEGVLHHIAVAVLHHTTSLYTHLHIGDQIFMASHVTHLNACTTSTLDTLNHGLTFTLLQPHVH